MTKRPDISDSHYSSNSKLKSRRNSQEHKEDHDFLDETVGDMFRSSYYNPSMHSARFGSLKSVSQSQPKLNSNHQRSPENISILKSTEKRVNNYLHRQKKQQLYGFHTMRNMQIDPIKEIQSK